MNYIDKYLKYKNKYINYKNYLNNNNNNQIGGAYENYILLSCPEFNTLVDDIINKDSNITLNNLHIPNIYNCDKDYSRIDNTLYTSFLKDIGIKDDDASKDDIRAYYKDKYMRKINNYESDNYFRGYINWKSYPDNTPDIKMNSTTVGKLRGGKVIYFAYFSFNEPNVTSIIDQLLFLNALNHYGVSEINIVLPYFPVGTMERIVGEGEIPTAYSLANLLNNIPSGASKNNLYIFDIHALCSRFFFHTNTRPILISMMPNFINYIETEYDKNDLNIIVYPDDGAKKRFEKSVPSYIKTITCSKTRKGEDRIIKINESDIHNLANYNEKKKIYTIKSDNINLFILDDLVQSGGTLLETIEGIKIILSSYKKYNESKIKYISIVTHSVFPKNDNLTKFFDTKKNVHKYISTNSRPLRSKYIEENYPEKSIIMNISEPLHDIFTNKTTTKFITPNSIN